jgi:hypothetical protein
MITGNECGGSLAAWNQNQLFNTTFTLGFDLTRSHHITLHHNIAFLTSQTLLLQLELVHQLLDLAHWVAGVSTAGHRQGGEQGTAE